MLQPLPVVDVTKEEEKYGNEGDKFNRIGRGFIGGVETLSSMLTSALSVNTIYDLCIRIHLYTLKTRKSAR